ncbi:MAG: N-acetyl-gamma-glutamyl-phosphate reductase, partial [Sphingobacteriales bacterium]
MIKAGIIGSAGYTGGELIRLLVNHPVVSIHFVHSKSNAGNPVHKIHADLLGDTDLHFTGELDLNVDVLFLCAGHGEGMKFLQEVNIPEHIRIIDLSNDFRLKASSV